MNQTASIHQDLIADSIKGSNKARYQLYQLYSKAMFNVCYRMMNNREEAEDILQEAFVVAFQKLDTFRNESGFLYFLLNIFNHSILQSFKPSNQQSQSRALRLGLQIKTENN